jgi:ferrochelatase
MGGPSSIDQIGSYLKAIFNDPAILPFPGIFRKFMASLIASKRTPKVAERYRQIGGLSPLPRWTRLLRDNVEKAMNESSAIIKVAYAFRYISPTIEQTVRSLAKSGIDEIRLIPLFPHYTGAMTGSISKEAKRICDMLGIGLTLTSPWAYRKDVLKIWYKNLANNFPSSAAHAHILFVAHGIPLRDVRHGDTYPDRVAETANQLGQMLPDGYSWSLAYQSRVGPVKWTEPYLEAEIDRIASSNLPLIFMPLSFVADCLETLYDLDIVASTRARDAGAVSVRRVAVFNDDPEFASILASIGLESEDNG